MDEEVFLEDLMNKYGKLVFSICYNLTKNYFDAEDLAQDTFLAAYKSGDKFYEGSEKAWICRIATNKSIDYLRKKVKSHVITEEEFFMDLKSREPTPEEYFLDMEVKEKMYILCEELRQPYGQIAKEHFCNGISVKELSQAMGKPTKTIQTQIYRAKAMLKVLWGKEYP